MICTLPRGLAFGRSGRVGIDGSLTGGAFSLFFIVLLGFGSGREEEAFLPVSVMFTIC